MLKFFPILTLLTLCASSAWSSESQTHSQVGTCQIKALMRSGSVQVNTLSLSQDECLWVAFLQAKGNFTEFKAGSVNFLVQGTKAIDAEIRFSPKVFTERTCQVTTQLAESNFSQQITAKNSMRDCLESALRALDQHPSLGHETRIDYSGPGANEQIVLHPHARSANETQFSDN